MSKILVIGSMNMDLVVQTKRAPEEGETIIGENFTQIPGGKGANQALTVGKLGGDVNFIGACGKDDFGNRLLESLNDGNVKIDQVFKVNDITGIANIILEESGENRIIVVPGANYKLSLDLIDEIEEEIKKAEIILLQLEIPLETVIKIINLAYKYNTKIVLDPAPAQKLPNELYGKIDFLLPNGGELSLLLKDYDLNTVEEKIEKLLELGVGKVLITKGEDGISMYSKNKNKNYPAVKVKAVDTTAAGDSFAGAFVYGIAEGWREEKAIKYAIIVSALVVTKLGAQSSLPSKKDVDKFKKEMGL